MHHGLYRMVCCEVVLIDTYISVCSTYFCCILLRNRDETEKCEYTKNRQNGM